MTEPESTCRGCGAPIRWAITEAKGRRIPLDLEPVDDGNLLFTGRDHPGYKAPLVRAIRADEAVPPARARYISHFVTCPSAKRFRKDKNR